MVTKYQKFGDGYKAEAVKLYRESNQTIAETARNLGLKESTLANWVKKDKDNEAVAVGEAPLTPAERTRIRELEADVRRLNMENAFLKKRVRTSRARTCEILVHWPGGGRAAATASRSALSRRFHVPHAGSDAAGILRVEEAAGLGA